MINRESPFTSYFLFLYSKIFSGLSQICEEVDACS